MNSEKDPYWHCIIAKLLVEAGDQSLLDNWQKLARGIELPESSIMQLVQMEKRGEPCSKIFTEMLQIWQSEKWGEWRLETSESLCRILKENSFFDAAEKVEAYQHINDNSNRATTFGQMSISEAADGAYSTLNENYASPINPALLNSAIEANSNAWLDELKVHGFLGKGSFGVVLKADNKITKAKSAVKFIFKPPNDKEDDEKQIEEMSREYKSLEGKIHENVVTSFSYFHGQFTKTDIIKYLKDAVQTRNPTLEDIYDNAIIKAKRHKSVNAVCIQMELCGPTLRSWLNSVADGAVTSNTFRVQQDIAEGLISGLTFLHENNVIHRDLKPENIYFSYSEDGVLHYPLPVKIGDFGLCREVTDDCSMTLTNERGTRLYRAPEVDEERYGKQADLFSLGLILFEVFQSTPYKQLSTEFNKLREGNTDAIKENPLVSNLREIIIGLTKRNREERLKHCNSIKLEVN